MERILNKIEGAGAYLSRALSRFFTQKTVCILLAAILLLSLLPLLALAKYDRPTGDDYAFSYYTKPAWDETHSVVSLVENAARMSALVYRVWQGSYSAIFLMALQPGLFSERAYAAVPFLLIFTFLLAVAVFFHTFLRRVLGADGWATGSAASLFALTAVHFLPSGAQAFYWFNGSIYYTFYFSLSLLLASLIGIGLVHQKHTALRCVLGALLALFIAGGNWATGLTVLVLLAGASVVSLLYQRRDPALYVSALAFLAGFAVNFLAPGNAIRMQSENTQVAAPVAILRAIQYTLELYHDYLTVPVLLLGALGALALLPALDRLSARFRFRFPFLVCAGLILINAVGMAPLVYSGSQLRIPRLHNVLFYEAALLYILALSYAAGRILRLRRENPAGFLRPVLRGAAAAGVLLTALFLLPDVPFNPRTQTEPSALSACHSLINRDAYRYARSRNRQEEILTDPSVTDAVVDPIYAVPELFHFHNFSTDPAMNELDARYFNKDSVACTLEIDAN